MMHADLNNEAYVPSEDSIAPVENFGIEMNSRTLSSREKKKPDRCDFTNVCMYRKYKIRC